MSYFILKTPSLYQLEKVAVNEKNHPRSNSIKLLTATCEKKPKKKFPLETAGNSKGSMNKFVHQVPSLYQLEKVVVNEKNRPRFNSIKLLMAICSFHKLRKESDISKGVAIPYYNGDMLDLSTKYIQDNILNISKSTIQREFRFLEDLGLIKRVICDYISPKGRVHRNVRCIKLNCAAIAEICKIKRLDKNPVIPSLKSWAKSDIKKMFIAGQKTAVSRGESRESTVKNDRVDLKILSKESIVYVGVEPPEKKKNTLSLEEKIKKWQSRTEIKYVNFKRKLTSISLSDVYEKLRAEEFLKGLKFSHVAEALERLESTIMPISSPIKYLIGIIQNVILDEIKKAHCKNKKTSEKKKTSLAKYLQGTPKATEQQRAPQKPLTKPENIKIKERGAEKFIETDVVETQESLPSQTPNINLNKTNASQEHSVGAIYHDASIKDFTNHQKELKDSLFGWVKNRKDLLLFVGDPGIGKTRFCAAMMNDYCKSKANPNAPFYGRYFSFVDLMAHMKSNNKPGYSWQDKLKEILDADFLVIDDVRLWGENKGISRDALQMILDERTKSRKPTIITSNHDVESLQRLVYDSTFSRMMSCDNLVIEMHAKDRRRVA